MTAKEAKKFANFDDPNVKMANPSQQREGDLISLKFKPTPTCGSSLIIFKYVILIHLWK